MIQNFPGFHSTILDVPSHFPFIYLFNVGILESLYEACFSFYVFSFTSCASITIHISVQSWPSEKIYGPEYLCENSKDKMRNYSNPDTIKVGRDANKMGRKIHRILHTHFCPCPYLAQHSATKRKAPISGFFLETETKEWTEHPMFWLIWGLP